MSETRNDQQTPAEVQVGSRVRELRARRGFSLRALAELSGLNVNTLSLIENGKTSPSVSTLQQLAGPLGVSLAALFENERIEKPVIFTPAGSGKALDLGSTRIQNLGKDYAQNTVQPLLVTLPPGQGSGDRVIVHTGHEFVYCLSGVLLYQIADAEYHLQPGDSLLFQAHLPHRWVNPGKAETRLLLLLIPSDRLEDPGGRHFIEQTERGKNP